MSLRRRLWKATRYLALGLLALLLAATLFVWWQGRATPSGTPVYVALGSSFTAGAGLGPLQAGSPLLCARSVGGYPQRLARQLPLPIVDLTCGGAKTTHLRFGGQFFQGPQIRVIDARTRLVTITVGGNDVGLIGDLSLLAMRRQPSLRGWLTRRLWRGPARHRNFAALERELIALIRAIRARAPAATIVLATYPAILPPAGTCPQLQLSQAEVDDMRPVEMRLAAVTAAAARKGGALLVDLHALGAAHHACAAAPWVRGWAALGDAPFHPTPAGARATAAAIAASPAGIAAVRQHDAARHQARRVGRQE